MELRQLEAFVAVGTELHFGRAAEKLHMGQPTLSDLVRRLERELGATLLTRTTRRVALTQAGTELLGRAKFIIDSVEGATAAVRRVAEGGAGRVRIGITPPVAPILAPHLAAAFKALAPDVDVTIRRMWLPDLERTVADIDGELDLAITCAKVPDPPGIISEIFCAEPLFVTLRPDHRLAGRHGIELAELAGETLGLHSAALFPAWVLALRQVLEAAGVAPPTVELTDTDLSAGRWAAQHEVDWILTTKSVAGSHVSTPLIPVSPSLHVPYTLQWCPIRAASAAVGRFVDLALSVDVPPGWVTQHDHLRHTKA
ncbi:LysR family transcriptional regulator [Mycolicibacterium cosmeticum]|uniref:Probable hydrogen peroxide-inducible genes activator n=1 Tax=Mycolicibacterium cosmeticum TaxID=258533 RepID=W9BL34_MYCCO|nr:LysR family transcriptional regulator [Mycolicibacterium cosmeticum]CDO08955.1 LysR family transcriptional regulator [Mycolicibacterium cosmeticum]